MADAAVVASAPMVEGGDNQPDFIPIEAGQENKKEVAAAKKLAKKRSFLESKKKTPEVKAKRLKERAAAALGGEVAAAMFLHELRPNLEYKVISMTGPIHTPIFTMQLELDGKVFEAQGNTKKKAKASLAEKVLQDLMANMDLGLEADMIANKAESKDSDALATGKSPVMILSYIRPQLHYDVVSEPKITQPAPPPPTTHGTFKMAVTVDDVRFEAEGRTKKIAKANACKAALESLFGLQCVPGIGGVPVYMGEDSTWSSLRVLPTPGAPKPKGPSQASAAPIEASTLGFPLPGNKHPLVFIHELYPQIEFKMADAGGAPLAVGGDETVPPVTPAGPPGSFTCSVRVEDFDFFGEGSTKKVAKLNAAVAALTAINSAGILAQRVSEREAKRVNSPKWKPSQRALFEQNDGGTAAEGSGEGGEGKKKGSGGPVVRNALMKLNELHKGLAYEDIGHTIHTDERGKSVNQFDISVQVDGQYYEGRGMSKKLAKLGAAEAALRGIGQWTEEDERVKATLAQAYAETVAKNAEKMRQNQINMRASGGGIGWKGHGGGKGGWRGHMDLSKPAAWVPGGVLHGNEAPLLVGGNTGYAATGAPDYSLSAADYANNFLPTGGADQGQGGGMGGMMGGGYSQQQEGAGMVGGAGYGPYGEKWGPGGGGGGFQGQSTGYQQF